MIQQLDKVVNIRSEPGVIIFNNKRQVGFINQVALEIFKSKDSDGHRNVADNTFKLPPDLSSIHTELKARISRHKGNGCSDGVYLKKIIPIRKCHFLISAFIISAPPKPTSTQFLVLIDKMAVRSEVDLDTARRHFGLSSKEFEVVQLLIGGRTNKEIANELHIAECTVKEYLRTVMSKVGASTRAGVVAQILTFSGAFPLDWKQDSNYRPSHNGKAGHFNGERILSVLNQALKVPT